MQTLGKRNLYQRGLCAVYRVLPSWVSLWGLITRRALGACWQKLASSVGLDLQYGSGCVWRHSWCIKYCSCLITGMSLINYIPSVQTVKSGKQKQRGWHRTTYIPCSCWGVFTCTVFSELLGLTHILQDSRVSGCCPKHCNGDVIKGYVNFIYATGPELHKQ